MTNAEDRSQLQPAPLQLVCQPLPIVAKLPPIIVSSDSITLDQLAVGSATVPANLTPECQRLYSNVAGASITLDTADFPEFSKAIERSVNTEGLFCWKLLQQKSPEFGYLRITLGADLGNSPGAPYVLEIWPALHASVTQFLFSPSDLTLMAYQFIFQVPHSRPRQCERCH